MSSSLYDSIYDNNKIIANPSLRHPKFCLDVDFINKMNSETKSNKLSSLNWQKIGFRRTEVGKVPAQRGVYMFIVKPYDFSPTLVNADFILYIGQSKNLKDRFQSYFSYRNAKDPKDQEKRKMILIWGENLWFYFQNYTNISKPDLDDLEYDLIDCIMPPFNSRFRAEFVKSYRKIIYS